MARIATVKSVTTSELAKLCALSRLTVVGWISTRILASYVLPGQPRRIRIVDALAFFRARNAPCEALERFAERCGAVPMVSPGVLICSPEPAIAATFAASGWSTTLALSPVQSGIAMCRLHYLATVIDGAFGSQSVCDLVAHAPDAGVLALLAAEDDRATPSTWKSRGFEVVYRKPIDSVALAHDLRGLILPLAEPAAHLAR